MEGVDRENEQARNFDNNLDAMASNNIIRDRRFLDDEQLIRSEQTAPVRRGRLGR